LSERRHRLYSREIPEVIERLRLRLEGLLEKKTDLERAEIAFRTMYRLEGGIVGRPRYPARAVKGTPRGICGILSQPDKKWVV
jgi:hypothetical protein